MPTRKYAIITGAASGLGRALSVRLAQDGWHIALADTNTAGSAETLDVVAQAGGSGQVEPLDVTSPQDWIDLGRRLEAQWPALHLLVNNAGVACSGTMGGISIDTWEWALRVNLMGALYGCHHMIDWLKRSTGRRHIVNVASMAGVLSGPAMGPYNVSKAGVISLSETLYAELWHSGIGVTVVCPGFFRTGLLNVGRFQTDRHKEFARGLTERARITAADVAERIVKAMRRRKLYVFMPPRVTALWYAKRLCPQLLLSLFGRSYRENEPEQPARPPSSPAETEAVSSSRPC